MKALRAVLFDFDGTLAELKVEGDEADQLRNRLHDVFCEAGISLAFRPLAADLDRDGRLGPDWRARRVRSPPAGHGPASGI